MDARLIHETDTFTDGFDPVERIDGGPQAGALVICDHASNALPLRYGTLGLEPQALERHIAYDIGAAHVARALAAELGAPARLSAFSRLLIDANRGGDDPTLTMRFSDGAVVPGNARIDAGEIALRRRLYWAPYRRSIHDEIERMLAGGVAPALASIHSFTPVWRGAPRPWKVSVLWDRDPRLAEPMIAALRAEPDLAAHEVGDNEPYEGGLKGDTIHDAATARGLANVLIEIRQDLIAAPAAARAWAARLARLLGPLIADPALRAPRRFASRADGNLTTGAGASMAPRLSE